MALTFESSPAGLQLVVGSSSAAAPFSREVIIGSTNSVSAPAQTFNGTSYVFSSWSHGQSAKATRSSPRRRPPHTPLPSCRSRS